MGWNDELFSITKQGAQAEDDGDLGRSDHLGSQVVDIMSRLSAKECEWLIIAVGNGAMKRQFRDATVNSLVTEVHPDGGEVWDM